MNMTALNFACAQSMKAAYDELIQSFQHSATEGYLTDRQRQQNTNEFLQQYEKFILSDKFWELNKENFIAFAITNNIDFDDEEVQSYFDKRHFAHKELANGFLSCVAAIAAEPHDDIKKKTSLVFDLRSQLFKYISNSIVNDSANVIQLKLLSEANKRTFANELLNDPSYLHLINVANNANAIIDSKNNAFDKVFSLYDPELATEFLNTGIINKNGQQFIAYIRSLDGNYDPTLFQNGKNNSDLSNCLAYTAVLNYDNQLTWSKFANSVDLSNYFIDADGRRTNALVHFMKSIYERSDSEVYVDFLKKLDSSTYKKMADPKFLSTLNNSDAKFVFNSFLDRYIASEANVKSLNTFLQPDVLKTCPFIFQALLQRHQTREIAIDYCLQKGVSPATYASSIGINVKPLVDDIYGYNSLETNTRVVDHFNALIEAQPEGSIAKAKAIYQAIEFRVYLYKGGATQRAAQDMLLDNLEDLSREFRINLQQGLENLGPTDGVINLSDIIGNSKWVGDIEIDRVQRIANRVMHQYNIENSIGQIKTTDIDTNMEVSEGMKPY
jgi:hypothetical protein